MKKQEKEGLEEVLGKIAEEMDFDYHYVGGTDDHWCVRAGYDDGGDIYGLDLRVRVTGPAMFRFVATRVINYLLEDKARK